MSPVNLGVSLTPVKGRSHESLESSGDGLEPREMDGELNHGLPDPAPYVQAFPFFIGLPLPCIIVNTAEQ